MAEAIARNLYPKHQFYSAGIETHGMNPYAINVCEELKLTCLNISANMLIH